MKNVQNKVAKRKTTAVLLSLVTVVSLCIFATSCGSSTSTGENEAKKPGISWDVNAEEGGLTQKSEEEIQEELNKKVEEGMINISMNTAPIFETGTSKGNLLIVNSERNNHPQVVYIVLKDTGEEIYRSGAIAVGSKIEQAALDVDLDPGIYNCVAYFNNVNVETGEVLGTAGAEIQITVKG